MTKPYYQDSRVTLYHGDCREVLPQICGVDAVVTDPPYGLSFMGKAWDYDVPSVELWCRILDACKPGAHLLSFAGTRTQHRMCVNIEDAGFEIRDMIAWVYGSGFPKSLDVSKAIDKAAGVKREVVGFDPVAAKRTPAIGTNAFGDYKGQTGDVTAPATDAARQWSGWGTALKPALEPITVARRPLVGTVAANVLQHGTGALNIDGCRVEGGGKKWESPRGGIWATDSEAKSAIVDNTLGRWPANLIHDGSDEVVALTGEQARFFYCAKASKKDRDGGGCEGLPQHDTYSKAADTPMRDHRNQVKRGNHHPTVKPTELMRYLCRLVTPPNGVILDPFMGSGSTGKAAVLEGFRFIGIERDEQYLEIAVRRIQSATGETDMEFLK